MRLCGYLSLGLCLLTLVGCEERRPVTVVAPPAPGVQNAPLPTTPPQNQQPKSLVQSIRAAAYRPQRQNELRQIALFFQTFHDERKHNPKTDEEFSAYIQRDAGGIAQALRDKYYVLNLRVNMRGPGVIAYESPLDGGNHLVVFVGANVAPMSPADLKKALGP